MVGAVHELSPQVLGHYGIKAVMLDLDDTLIPVNGNDLSPIFRNWLNALKAQMPVIILSNGKPERVKYWAGELDVMGFALAGKPFAFAFKRGLRALGTEAGETVMIGDQLFTDILGAKLAGLKTILVKPLSAGGLPHTRVLRKLEKLILREDQHGRSFHR
jgi:hypothetical protein